MITLGLIDNGYLNDSYVPWLEALDPGRFHFEVRRTWPSVEQATQAPDGCRPQVWMVRARSFLNADCLRSLCGGTDGLRPIVAICENDIDDVSRALSERVAAVALVNDPLWYVVSAIHSAAARRFFLSPMVLDQFRDQVIDMVTTPESGRLETLTDREHDVLILLAEGNSNSRIAERLHVTRATVGSHVLSILRKLDAANRTEAAATAHQLGLVTRRGRGRGPGRGGETRGSGRVGAEIRGAGRTGGETRGPANAHRNGGPTPARKPPAKPTAVPTSLPASLPTSPPAPVQRSVG